MTTGTIITDTKANTVTYIIPFARALELRVKALSLTAEARIIKAEERRLFRADRTFYAGHLHKHRKEVVRTQARLTHLARAFIRGTPYRAVEGEGSKPVDMKALRREIFDERKPPHESIAQARTAAVWAWLDPGRAASLAAE